MTRADADRIPTSRSLSLACTILSLLLIQQRCEAVSRLHPLSRVAKLQNPSDQCPLLLDLRGGSSSPSSSNRKKKKSSSKKSKSGSPGGTSKKKKKKKRTAEEDASGDSSDETSSEGKAVIGEAMEKDAAETLGDAIRSRADELRSENPLLSQIDQSVYSVGWALGASDRRSLGEYIVNMETDVADDSSIDGGVAGSPSSVLVNYFLKSHGGAHALQCLCSLLASSAGFACLLVSAESPMKRVLLQRALLFAMTKHVAGLLGAAFIAARAIPQVGLRKARVWMEQLARDPVSHYVFYSACILLWLPTNSKLPLMFAGNAPWLSALLLGPILLREIVSTMLVASDIMVLWATSSGDNNDDLIQTILQTSQKAINILMSLLVTPEKWRSADPAVRQRILAKLTSKISLALEVMVGAVIVLDALVLMGRIVFGNASLVKPPFGMVIKRLLCSRIFLQYLWTRKRRINRLAVDIRGGAAGLPFYVLDVLVDPRAAVGLPERSPVLHPPVGSKTRNLGWKDYFLIALGLEE